MERNAHYALVGAVSLLICVGAIVFAFWLARVQFSREYDVYDVDFKGPVRGLSVGGEVYFNGIKVGSVAKLSLDRIDPNRVVARIRISSDAPVRVDSVASLDPQGITGVSYVQISAGTPNKPLLKDTTPDGVIPVISSRQSALESLLQGGGDVLTRTVEILDQVKKLMSDQNVANMSATLADVKAVADATRSQTRILADLDQTIRSVDTLSQHVQSLSDNANGLLTNQGRQTLDNLNAAAGELKATAVSARQLVDQVKGPTADFAETGLPRLAGAITTLQQTAVTLNRVVGDIERNPRSLLTKPPAVEMKVKP